jgi:syntaxin 18
MPFLDLTNDFRSAVEVKRLAIPEARRGRFSTHRQDAERDAQVGLGKEYLAEAYKIVRCFLCQ